MNVASDKFKYSMVSVDILKMTVKELVQCPGYRFGHLTARIATGNNIVLETLVLDTNTGGGEIIATILPASREYSSLTSDIPAAHWAERLIGDFFGIRAVGHPRWKSLILHDISWPIDFFPLAPGGRYKRPFDNFMNVEGEGVHEIPVGPIHAGIIEPGHFRFSCVGEIITNLEVQLGYQHRGIEYKLAKTPWNMTHFLAESTSSDTAAANALAHTTAIESLLRISPSPRVQALRTIALEIERLANHVGDIGALSGDIGYSAGAALFPPMRGAALSLAQYLTGNRRQRWYIKPGGVSRDLSDDYRATMIADLAAMEKRLAELIPLVIENPAVIERMEGTGRISPSLARDFGLVGPAGRAAASGYDVREAFAHGVYPEYKITPVGYTDGDVLARAQMRVGEIKTSIAIIRNLLISLPAGSFYDDCANMELPADSTAIGIVEAWRGELIHWVTTDENGKINRYSIKDPSFNNWTGLAIAARGNLVTDFPLCNKSFNLSYSGNDL